jgi:hypothetical protein
MRRLTILAAALLAAAPGVANAAEPPCLTSTEFTSLAEYALPSIITGTTERCNTALPPSAYLRRSGADLAQRYAERKPAAWPGAKAAFLKLSTTSNADANNLLRTLPDTSLQQMADALMAGMVSQHLPLDRCTTVDRIIGLLSPLPPQSTAEVIALAVGLGTQAGQAKVGGVSICQA